MRSAVQLSLSIASILYATVGHAIFADEAYQTDYHHALLGFPQAHATFFHRPSPASKASLLFTLSERLVLGAVNPKDGAIIWRQQLADQAQNQTAVSLLRAGEGGDTLVTAVGGVTTSWDARDGRLGWQRRGNARIKSLDITEGDRDVLIFTEGQSRNAVRRLSADTGAILWEHNDSSGDSPYAVLSSKESVFLISLHSALLKGFKVRVTELSTATGNPIGQPILLSSDSEVTSDGSIIHVGRNSGVPFLIWTDKALKTLKVNIIGTKHTTPVSVLAGPGDRVEEISVHAPTSPAAKACFLVHYQGADSHWAEVYHINSGKVSKAYDLPRLDGRGSFSASSQGSDVYFIRHTEFENILVSSEASTVLNQWKTGPDSSHGLVDVKGVTHVVSEVISRGGSTYAVRSALALLSRDWELIRNGELLWTRREGLAGIVRANFIGIAREESLAEELAAEVQSDPLTAYVHRVKRHVRDIQHIPVWVEALPERLFGNLIGAKIRSADQSLHLDSFGSRKLIILATDKGRLAALDTGNRGSVIWNIQAVSLEPGRNWEVLNIEAEDGTVLVHGAGGEFLRVVSDTGVVLQYQPGAIISSLKTSVPVEDASGTKILIPVDADGSLQDVPPVMFSKRTTVVTQDGNNVIRGWALGEGNTPVLLWSFTPAAGEQIADVSARPPHDPVASIGKVLGDRNVLYKYLNPNILLITTLAANTSTASFYVLDGTSGALIYSTSHPGVDVSKPVISTMSENWIAYSLFSESNAITHGATQVDREKVKGYQLVVSEFYESPHPNDRGSLGSSVNSSSIYPPADQTEDILGIPYVFSQTFLIPGPISSMSVTSTLQGITTRSLLCVVPDLNSVFSISRAIVDPRRPVGRDPTAAEVEEGLFRYNPILDFEPKWMLNHKRDLISVSRIITIPSLLESTSLVFAFGDIDLFGTRTAPIGAFDILGNGFSKLQLVLTVVALAVGTTLVAPFVRRKQIDGSWKT